MLDPDPIHERRTLSFSSLISACEYLPGLDKNIRLSVQSRDAIIDISPSVDTGGGVTNDTDGNDGRTVGKYYSRESLEGCRWCLPYL